MKPSTKTIYCASSVRHAEKWRELRKNGWNIISTWIDVEVKDDPREKSLLWENCINESSRADILIHYVEDGDRMRGALVEVGCALGNNKKVYWIGNDRPSCTTHKLVTICESVYEALMDVINVELEFEKSKNKYIEFKKYIDCTNNISEDAYNIFIK